MKKLLLIPALILGFLIADISAQRVVNVHNNNVRVEILTDNSQEFSFRIHFPEPEFQSPVSGKEGHFGLTINGCRPSFHDGKPALPVWNKLIEIPHGARCDVFVTDVQQREIKTPQEYAVKELVPVQPSRAKSDTRPAPWIKDSLVYGQNDWFEYVFASHHNGGFIRNTYLKRLFISPISYHTGTRQVKLVTSAVVTLKFVPSSSTEMAFDAAAYQTPFMDLSGYTLNNGASSQIVGQGGNSPVGYVILADSMFQTTLQPFIEWKRRKGFTVTEVYKGSPGVGSTAASMKSYLQNLYLSATPSNPAPTFLLIVGDVQQIPAFAGTTGNHPTDLYYAEFTGDIYPEMLYGRFSATTTAHLQAQIDKTLHMEKFLMTDPAYLSQMILVAGNDQDKALVWANGQINYAQSEYVNSSKNLTPHTWLYPASIGQSAPIIQQFNQGASIVNYTAHGGSTGWSDPSFTNTHVATLTNTGKYPLVISNACQTNTFQFAACFGETILRAGNKGAVGHIGASNLTYWDEDYHFAVGVGPIVQYPTYAQTGTGFYDRLFHTHGEPYAEWAVTQGSIIMAGNLAVTQSGASLTNYYWEVYHLMGDPSLMPYLGIPSPMTVQHPTMLPTGLTQVIIQAPPYSYAAISSNGVLHGAGLADPYGHAIIHINPLTQPAVAELVITGQNLIPYIDTIHFVTPSGPFILADSIVMYDLTGNNNQKADAGELIHLGMRLRNYTSFQGAPLTVRILNASSHITLVDSVFTIPSLAGLATLFSNGDLAFQIAPFVPDQQSVTVILRVEQGAQHWSSPFNFVINSARINILNARLHDPAGNNNGEIEPGEPFAITLQIRNEGHADLNGVQITLNQNSPYLQLAASIQTIPVFAANQSYMVTFTGNAFPGPIPTGSLVKLVAIASQGSYTDTLNTYKMLAPLQEDFETNNFSKYPWTLTGSQHWFTTTVDPYEGATCSRSGAIPSQSSTTMSITLPVIASDSISFYYKVSSELDYDFLRFRINQVEVGRWSGLQANWSRAAFPVDSGEVTFSWSYEKDYYMEDGQDCAWIDYIVFPVNGLFIGQNEPDLLLPLSLQVFPNPSDGDLNVVIHQGASATDGTLLLFSVDGRLMHQRSFSREESSIHISGHLLPKGVYLLVADTPAGSQSRKIIKL
jgi:hypothetical protein